MDVNTFENSIPTYTTITPFFSAYLQMNNKPNKNKNKIIKTRQQEDKPRHRIKVKKTLIEIDDEEGVPWQ